MAQARARGRAVLGTGTVAAGPGSFRIGPNSTVLVSAQRAWPVWKTIVRGIFDSLSFGGEDYSIAETEVTDSSRLLHTCKCKVAD